MLVGDSWCVKSQEGSTKMVEMQRRLHQLQGDLTYRAEQQSQKATSQQETERQSHKQALCLLQVTFTAFACSADPCQSQ